MKTTLTKQCIYHASKWFSTIEDMINIEKSCKKFRGNMETFKYNPVSLDANTKKFFPNIETLHLYSKNDKKLTSKKLKEIVIWSEISYSKINNSKKEPKIKETYKSVFYSEKDAAKEISWFGPTIPKNVNVLGPYIVMNDKLTEDIEIPYGVTRICGRAFCNARMLSYCKFPNTIKIIEGDAFDSACFVDITIPESLTLQYDRMFNNLPYLQSFYLGEFLETVNKKPVEISTMPSFEVPSYVTKLGCGCFANSWSLREITIPTSVISFEDGAFRCCCRLSSITIPSTVTYLGKECFFRCTSLDNVVIPKSVKYIGERCFEECKNLKSIQFEDKRSIEFGKGCFRLCSKGLEALLDLPHQLFIK